MAEKVSSDQLAEILGTNRETVMVNQEAITVSPFKLKHVSDALRCLQALAEGGVDMQPFAESDDVENPKINLKREFNLAKALLLAGEPMMEMLAIGAKRYTIGDNPRPDIEWAGDLDPDEAVELGTAIWKVNKSFFVHKGPAIKAALGPVWLAVEPMIQIVGRPEFLALFALGLNPKKSANSPSNSSTPPSTPQAPETDN